LRPARFTPEFAMLPLRDAAHRPRTSAGVLAAGLLALAGCGGPRLYPVHRQIVWGNGGAGRGHARGPVPFESPRTAAGAPRVARAGSFRLGTHKPGDGALLGKPRVGVTEYSPREPPPPPIMDPVFAKLETSGLEITVERKTNEVTLKVRRAPPQQRK